MNKLPDELVEELLSELEVAGGEYAHAKGERFLSEQERRILRSELMQVAKSIGHHVVAAQTAYSETAAPYRAAVKRQYQAIIDEGQAEMRYRNAEKRWESWRTINANQRYAR